MEGQTVGKLRTVLVGLKRPVTALSFARCDEDLIAAGDEEGHVCLWRLKKQDDENEDEASIHITKANLPWYVCFHHPFPLYLPEELRFGH